MSRKTFEQYGELAKTGFSEHVIAGRYRIHAENEPFLIKDIITKLDLQPSDNLLEVGCGPGNVLIPLSFMVKSATGIDHENVISCLVDRFSDTRLKAVATNFLDYEPDTNETYDKILINSVITALKNADEAIEFIEKACSLLAANGRLLIGDIANIDKKKRFMETTFGKDFNAEWQKRMSDTDSTEQEGEAKSILCQDSEMLTPDDEFIIRLIRHFRRSGWEAFILPQPNNLPFGYTREDILIVRLPL